MKNRKLNLFIDFWVILINFTYRLSILGGVVDLIPIRFTNIRLLLPLVVIYLFRFGIKFDLVALLKKSSLLSFWLFLLSYEVIQGLMMFKITAVDLFIVVVYDTLLLSYLFNIYLESSDLQACKRITRPLNYYCLYNMSVLLIAAILLMVGILNPSSNDISDKFNLFATNVTIDGARYCFPGYLSVCEPTSFRVLGLWGVPDLYGLSHEGQALCFSIFPAFLLILGSLTDNPIKTALLYFLLFVTLVTTASATAMICIMAVLFVDIIWKSIIKKQVRVLLIVFFVIIVAFTVFAPVLTEYSLFFDSKIGGGASSDYSKITLKYVINPRSIVGDGILIDAHGDEMTGREDVGLISCCLLLCFYACVMFKTLRCILSRNALTHYIGLASLYFWLHALKYSVFVFSYQYHVLILFLLAFAEIFEKTNKRNKINQVVLIN